MLFGNSDMYNDLVLSVLQHIFHRNCTIDDIRKTHTDLLQSLINDILYLTGTSIETVMCSTHARNSNPSSKIIRVLEYIQSSFMHRPDGICYAIYMHLNDRLTDIIKKSAIEHDISIAYLIKRVIKEILINGIRYINNDNVYRYTWKDKLEAFYYICGYMRCIEAASMRANRSNHCQSVDLISSLNRVRQLTERKTLIEIINESLYA